jgi:hypothetical protein
MALNDAITYARSAPIYNTQPVNLPYFGASGRNTLVVDSYTTSDSKTYLLNGSPYEDARSLIFTGNSNNPFSLGGGWRKGAQITAVDPTSNTLTVTHPDGETLQIQLLDTSTTNNGQAFSVKPVDSNRQ